MKDKIEIRHLVDGGQVLTAGPEDGSHYPTMKALVARHRGHELILGKIECDVPALLLQPKNVLRAKLETPLGQLYFKMRVVTVDLKEDRVLMEVPKTAIRVQRRKFQRLDIQAACTIQELGETPNTYGRVLAEHAGNVNVSGSGVRMVTVITKSPLRKFQKVRVRAILRLDSNVQIDTTAMVVRVAPDNPGPGGRQDVALHFMFETENEQDRLAHGIFRYEVNVFGVKRALQRNPDMKKHFKKAN